MHSINRYAEMREQTSRVGERQLILLPKIPNELELQARWFAGEFGRKFRTLAGESVEIVQFGFWNREAGPDFQDAVVRIGDGPALRGTIEIDLLDRNWELHGHATNPAFDDAILHVIPGRCRGARLQTKPTALHTALPAFAPGFFAKPTGRRRSVAFRRRWISRPSRSERAKKIHPRLSAFFVGSLVEISRTILAAGS